MLQLVFHDLNAPLRAIRFYTDKIQRKHAQGLDQEVKENLDSVQASAQRMHQLLMDIELLSQCSTLKPPHDRVEARELVEEALRQLDDHVRQTGARVSLGDDLPVLHVHRVWAGRAITNLLDNALKFHAQGTAPQIEVAAHHAAAGEVGLVIRDRGIGIREEQADEIFHIFRRGVSREIRGTGIGLALVRLVAQRHHGRAWAEPRRGGGSVFYITFADACQDRRPA